MLSNVYKIVIKAPVSIIDGKQQQHYHCHIIFLYCFITMSTKIERGKKPNDMHVCSVWIDVEDSISVQISWVVIDEIFKEKFTFLLS